MKVPSLNRLKGKPERRKFRELTVIHSYITIPLGLEIVRLIWDTNIKPNHITLFRVLLNILAIACFVSADLLYIVIGFFLFQIHEILDHADGMLAHMKGMTSQVGVFMEIFFDTIFSSSCNLLGLSIAFSGYTLTNSFVYFYLYMLMTLGNNLTIYYKKQFNDESNISATTVYDKGEFLSIFDKPLKIAIKNIIITMFVWQNQFLLWGLVLYSLIEDLFKIDVLLIGFIIVSFLNQIPWIYWAYNGFIGAIGMDADITSKKDQME